MPRNNRRVRRVSIFAEIACGGEIGVDAHDALESLRQRKREKPDAGVQVQREVAFSARNYRPNQILHEKAIHLEKRKMTDAELVTASFLDQVSGAREFEAVLLLIEKQQAVESRQGVMKKLREFGNWFRKFLEGDIERDLGISRIDEGFDFQRFRGQRTIACDFLESRERIGECGREHIAMID